MVDPKHEVLRILQIISQLLVGTQNGWVKWSRIAKTLEGSEQLATTLSAYANLPAYKHLFIQSGDARLVKLSEQGHQLVAEHGNATQEIPETERIANAVKRYAGRLEPIVLEVRGVSRIARAGKRFVHRISVNVDESIIASETPVSFRASSGRSVSGKVVGQEPDGDGLYVALDGQVFEAELPARLSIDRAFLLHQLAEQIRQLATVPPRIEPAFFNSSRSTPTHLLEDRNSLQLSEELAKLETPWTRFLWGPPGAGKTFALAHLVTRLIESDPNGRILLVAPSNRSVDVGVEHLLEQLRRNGRLDVIARREILRFGYPRKSQVIECPELLGPAGLDEINQEVKALSTKIRVMEREEGSAQHVAVLRAELLAVQEEVKDRVATHVRTCKVVATTTTLACLNSSPVSKQTFSTVLVDEATMVSPAVCIFLASLAERRFLLAGDPRQLGPVYENWRDQDALPEDFEWMGQDVFEKGKLSQGQGGDRTISTSDPRLARITSQRRCASEIWARVKHLYPEVLNLSSGSRLTELIDLPPSAGEAVVLLDTSASIIRGLSRMGYDPRSCERVHGSWQNQYTAELAIEVACTVASEAKTPVSIAIIAPYRAQVRLLRGMVAQEKRAIRTPSGDIEIEAGTVHQFQGSDADVVIFDLVDGPGRAGVGNLLRGDTGLRLVNVAITRAKGKLIVLANKTWFESTLNRDDNPLLWQLVIGQRPDGCIPVLPAYLPSPGTIVESPIEQALLDAMAKHQDLASVKPQFTISDEGQNLVSRADFAFPEQKYAVYCDGRRWHLIENRWYRDTRQRNKLAELGWIFSVFTGREINRDPDECARQVLKTFRNRQAQSLS